MAALQAATVAVTGADGQVGRALLGALEGSRARVTALCRRPSALRAGRVVSGPLEAPAAVEALRDADYVIHLAGALRPRSGDSYEDANAGTARAVASAVRESRVRRILYVSYVGAGLEARNPYLRAKALAEQALVGSGRDVVVLRSTHIVGSPEAPGPTAEALLARPGRPAVVLGSGRQLLAPVYLGDVVAALRAAMLRGAGGIYELAGPEQLLLDNLVRLLNRDPRIRIRHVPPWAARALGALLPTLPAPLVDVMLRDSVGDPSAAVAAFGLSLISLRMVWR
jgi:nucleoside-diphosphate-sugar epimerase